MEQKSEKQGWLPEVEHLARRRELQQAMGGPEGIARQHANGKLTVRERIDKFADPGSFREFMGQMGHGSYEDNELVSYTPRGGVDGICKLDGRDVVVTAGDFTVRGGSGGGDRGGLGM
jgi:acetyl-CoA carboxylase carboxyltransferase component